jgi:hypothetical protein
MENFSGKWRWANETSFLEITIRQDSTTITGTPRCIALSGKKIDDGGSDTTIVGTVNQSIANISVTSGFSNKTGTAKLTWISSTKIRFELLIPPKGEYYLPSNVELLKL